VYRVPGGRSRHADDDEHEVGRRQIDDQHVRSVAHLHARGDDDNNEEIAGQTDHGDQSEYGGYNGAYDVLKLEDRLDRHISPSVVIAATDGGVTPTNQGGCLDIT